MAEVVVVPARNEAPRIGAVLDRITATLPGRPVIVVDGASTDATARVARAHGALVVPQDGRGYPAALRTGLGWAAARGAQRLLLLDADGQHPPEEAPRLLSALDLADAVVGSRDGTGTPGPFGRRAGNAALAALVRLLTGIPLGDVTSGYWAFRGAAIPRVAEAMPTDVADANLRVLVARLGLRLAEVPVRMDARGDGASMHDGLAGVRNFGRSVRATLREALRAPPP
jgi:glycosyltransferase involved in cell wall biosynthesis